MNIRLQFPHVHMTCRQLSSSLNDATANSFHLAIMVPIEKTYLIECMETFFVVKIRRDVKCDTSLGSFFVVPPVKFQSSESHNSLR